MINDNAGEDSVAPLTRIVGGTLVTMNAQREITRADLVLRDGVITEIIPNNDSTEHSTEETRIEASGLYVFPGFIQTHIHLVQTLFRGIGDDLALLPWLKERIWPLEAAHDPDSVRATTRLAAAELLRGGTTAVLTMETVHHTDTVFETLERIPLYATVGKCLMDTGDEVPSGLLQPTEAGIRESVDLHSRWEGRAGGRLRAAFAPRFVLSCTADLHREVSKLAEAGEIPIHTHASEHRGEILAVRAMSGQDHVELLHTYGLTKAPLKLAHCVHLTPRELQILGDNRVSVLHCPTANLKLGSGIADITAMRRLGLNVSLGADGAACNNTLGIFQEMRTAALLQKMLHGPENVRAVDIVAMATIEGARALDRAEELGSIEIGKRANLAILDPGRLSTTPAPDPYGFAVYSADASSVRATIVDGEVAVADGELQYDDEADIVDAALKEAQRLFTLTGLTR